MRRKTETVDTETYIIIIIMVLVPGHIWMWVFEEEQ